MVVFVHDIFIYSKDKDENIIHLRTMLQTLRKHQLYDKLKKYEFWLEEVVSLAHEVFKDGNRVATRR